jgi:tetratricopeptide (TPR) repeat protein
VASSINKKNKLAGYKSKLDYLYQQFVHQIIPTSGPLEKARALFNWLWKVKPSRYKPQGNYRLGDVIDAQLSKDSQIVGNCLGLTLLYNCLLRKMGINAEALYLENAFGIGPHVLTLLQIEESLIDIENILPNGFDYKGHLDDPSRMRWRDKELVADIYHSLGNDFFKKGQWSEALNSYDMAIHLNPQYEKARLNKAILLDKMGREKEKKWK